MSDHGERDGFRIEKVGFRGAAGGVMALAAVAMLVDGVPFLRLAALVTIIGGGLCGVGLVLFRRKKDDIVPASSATQR